MFKFEISDYSETALHSLSICLIIILYAFFLSNFCIFFLFFRSLHFVFFFYSSVLYIMSQKMVRYFNIFPLVYLDSPINHRSNIRRKKKILK